MAGGYRPAVVGFSVSFWRKIVLMPQGFGVTFMLGRTLKIG